MRLGVGVLILLLVILHCGCNRLYFRPLDHVPPASPLPLFRLPVKTYWMGIVFNGPKIGFSRFELTRCAQDNRLDENA